MGSGHLILKLLTQHEASFVMPANFCDARWQLYELEKIPQLALDFVFCVRYRQGLKGAGKFCVFP